MKFRIRIFNSKRENNSYNKKLSKCKNNYSKFSIKNKKKIQKSNKNNQTLQPNNKINENNRQIRNYRIKIINQFNILITKNY